MVAVIWRAYLSELKSTPVIGPGTRDKLPPRLRQFLHFLFISFRYLGFYLIFKPIAWLIIAPTINLVVHGRENIPQDSDGIINTCNHLSNYDPLIAAFVAPRPVNAMTKIEYFQTPILGGIVIALGGFPVRRGEADRQALKSALAVLKLGGLLAVYPEGTRSKTFTLQPGHAGAALIASTADVSVLPTAIWGTENIMRRKKWGFLHRPRVDFAIGAAYPLKEAAATFAAAHDLTSSGKRGRHGDLDFMSDFMMLKIAELLPPEYRGEFTPEGIIARYHARAAQKSAAKTGMA